MANFCETFVTFSDKSATNKFIELYKNYSIDPTIEGQLLDPNDSNWIFDIVPNEKALELENAYDVCMGIREGDENPFSIYPYQIQFSSKWEPMFDELVNLANKHKSNFVMEYEEMGMCIYGIAEYDYESGILNTRELPRDFNETHTESNEDGGLRLKGSNDSYFDSESEYYNYYISEYGEDEVRTYPRD